MLETAVKQNPQYSRFLVEFEGKRGRFVTRLRDAVAAVVFGPRGGRLGRIKFRTEKPSEKRDELLRYLTKLSQKHAQKLELARAKRDLRLKETEDAGEIRAKYSYREKIVYLLGHEAYARLGFHDYDFTKRLIVDQESLSDTLMALWPMFESALRAIKRAHGRRRLEAIFKIRIDFDVSRVGKNKGLRPEYISFRRFDITNVDAYLNIVARQFKKDAIRYLDRMRRSQGALLGFQFEVVEERPVRGSQYKKTVQVKRHR